MTFDFSECCVTGNSNSKKLHLTTISGYLETKVNFFLIDMAVQAGKYSNASAYAAGSFFGFAAMIVYGFDGFLKFQGWRANQLAQGERVTQQAESVTY